MVVGAVPEMLQGYFRRFRRLSSALQGVRGGFRGFLVALHGDSEDFEWILEALQKRF